MMHAAAEVKTEPVLEGQAAALGRTGHPLPNAVKKPFQRFGGRCGVIAMVAAIRIDQFVGPNDLFFQSFGEQTIYIGRRVDAQQVLFQDGLLNTVLMPFQLTRSQSRVIL